jgi:predicted Zn finger-like uncharacterized protein
MIVTCPGCSSKYRVRNEVVPQEGARMRCPKCETLFLAKPPTGAEAQSTGQDDPSSMYQTLDPSKTGPMPQPALQQAAQAGVGKPQSGPITALFQAFDAANLPAEAQRPPPPPKPEPVLPPSGLEVNNVPRVRVASPAPTPKEPARPQTAAATQGPPPLGKVIGSYAAVAAGAVMFVVGFLFFAWTTELMSLDNAFMPMFENSFGVEPPRSHVHPTGPSEEDLKKLATAAQERGDLPSSIVLWRRVKARNASHPLALVQLPTLRQRLGEPAEEP